MLASWVVVIPASQPCPLSLDKFCWGSLAESRQALDTFASRLANESVVSARHGQANKLLGLGWNPLEEDGLLRHRFRLRFVSHNRLNQKRHRASWRRIM